MKKNFYYSHWSAARIWNIPYLESVFHEKMRKALHNGHQVTVFAAQDRFEKKGFQVHCCQIAMAKEARCNLRHVNVVSPAHTYLQLAHVLGVQDTILLGILMCASIDGRKPLTTPEELYRYVKGMRHHRGRQIALRALKSIKGNCRSANEAILQMIFSNSSILGGLRLPESFFNHKIVLPRQVAQQVGKHCFYADIYFPNEKVIVEYDSDEYHFGQERFDAERRQILESLGYKVLSITTHKLYDLEEFYDAVRKTGRLVKKRIRIRTPRFQGAFRNLRDRLPRLRLSDEIELLVQQIQEEAVFFRKILPKSLHHTI